MNMLTTQISGVVHAYELTGDLAMGDLAMGNLAQSPITPHLSPSDATQSHPTLVFIHGWLLSRAYWQPLVEQLSGHYRCLTYDLRGFGESVQGKSTTAYHLRAYAQDLGQLLKQLNLDNVWLVGHSLGGSIALWAAYLLPQQVKGVICINAGGGIYLPQAFAKFRTAGQQMVKFRPSWLPAVPLLPRIFSRLMVNQPLGPDWGKQRLRDFVRADRQAAEGALLDSTTCEEVHRLPQIVGQLTQPIHFITAAQDQIMPPRYVRYLASFHPSFGQESLVSELSDCGHMAMVEQPEAVAEVVLSTLATDWATDWATDTDWQCR
ncbi:MAG: alpha/beta hydrolase [Phormidesmis sp. RL_2_1]|nr:alpha/beta hydrolase [Phormidesmis sp. RL_2_1]